MSHRFEPPSLYLAKSQSGPDSAYLQAQLLMEPSPRIWVYDRNP